MSDEPTRPLYHGSAARVLSASSRSGCGEVIHRSHALTGQHPRCTQWRIHFRIAGHAPGSTHLTPPTSILRMEAGGPAPFSFDAVSMSMRFLIARSGPYCLYHPVI